jgi:anti-sigma B factor antagonist
MKFHIAHNGHSGKTDGVTVLTIEGQLDALTVTELRGELDKLVEQTPSHVEVDLTNLRLIDSSGVGALVSLYKRIRAQGGKVDIRGLRDQPAAIFKLLRLDRVMVGASGTGGHSSKTSKSRV